MDSRIENGEKGNTKFHRVFQNNEFIHCLYNKTDDVSGPKNEEKPKRNSGESSDNVFWETSKISHFSEK